MALVLRRVSTRGTLLSRPVMLSSCKLPRRLLSTAAPPPPEKGDKNAGHFFGMTTRHAGGVPDFIEHWNPKAFLKTGYGLIAATIASARSSV